MDFLDSLDLDVSYKRSRRVRSWYLYEQLKSLERNQIDAALRLRDRSFQDQVLRQELEERRARRTLYSRSRESHDSLFSRAQQRSVKSEGADSIHTGSIDDDLFLSFSELYDSGFAASFVADDISEQSSREGAAAVEDECKSLGEQEEKNSVAQSMQSVVYVKSDGTITGFKDHCYEECQDNCIDCPCEENCEEQVPHDSHDTVVEEINYYFDELKDNLEQIEKLAEYDCDIRDDQRIQSDIGCSVEEEVPVVPVKKGSVRANNKNIIAIWSKVVSFAHQLVQLNHGNCYSDYGSQILTAVLACDVLCRGISKICDILQPFVCPVRNYAPSDSDCSEYYCYKREKRKVKNIPKRGRCGCTANKPFKRNSIVHVTRTYCSDNWQRSQNTTTANPKKGRHTSEPCTIPLRSHKLFSKRSSKKYYDSSILDEFSDDTPREFLLRKKRPHCKMLNDMMELSEYFDNILKDIEETMQVPTKSFVKI